MLTLQNFDKQIHSVILQKGKHYYSNGNVAFMEETINGRWSAEVNGTEIYQVDVTLKGKDEISVCLCDCPYEGICKHVVAVLFALRDEIKKTDQKSKKDGKRDVFETLLQSITINDYQNFVRDHAVKNKNFKIAFELFFADRDGRIDVEKEYSGLLQKLVSKYLGRGYIDYKASLGLSREINKFLATGLGYIAKNNFKDAFSLAKVVLKSTMNALQTCDDSSGNIGGNVEGATELLEKIIDAETVAPSIKEEVFNFLQKELNAKIYFDYGDFGYNLFSLFQKLAIQLNKATEFITFVDAQILTLTGKYDNYRKEHFQKSKIEFLRQTGKTVEVEKLVQQNMDIVEVRMGVINRAIGGKDFNTAKNLIAAGIKLAESKDLPGTVAQWEKEFLRIALLEKDTATIKHYTKRFAFDRGFSTEYYQQWKTTFTAIEWIEAIDQHIAEIVQKVTEEWNKTKHKSWRPTSYPPLLQSLAPIYIQEKYWNKLLTLVQQVNDLDTTLNYHQYLLKDYPSELLDIYLPTLEEDGFRANSRSEYVTLVKKMEIIIKDIPEGKGKILNLAKRLKEHFSKKPRRPAMVEELSKIL
jgi:SWIM zinc finger